MMRNRIYLMGAVAGCLLLTSCGIYTSYQPKEVAVVDSLYRANCTVEEGVPLVAMGWRELFTDSLLQHWIVLGLEKNSDLNVARLKVEEARASFRKARLQFLPSLEVNPDGTINSNVTTKETTKTYSLGASASWELDVFGKQRNAKEQAKAELEENEAYRQAVETQLIASIAESYYSLLMMDRKWVVSSETLVTWEKNRRAMSALKQAGEYTEAAVAQAEANYVSAESDIVNLEQERYELENSFCTLIGIAPQRIERGEFANLDFPNTVSIGVPLQLVANRPDVRQAERALAASFYATNRARASFYPSVTLSGSMGWTNNTGISIVNPGEWIASVVGGLTQPLFSRGTNRANLKIAQLQQEAALISYTQSLLDAGAEVNNALSQWQTARKKLERDGQQIAALQRAVKSTQLLMQYGTTNYLEVLTAQQTLLQAALTQIGNQYEEVQGVIQLYHALGGGSED